MKSTRPAKKSSATGYLKKFRKKDRKNLVLATAFVVVFGIVGSLFLFLTHAQATYYKGNCTLTTVSDGSSGACVQQAQDLLDALEHAQIAAGHSYRTATGPGDGVFQYGSDYYLLMDGSYGSATANAVHRLTGSDSLTGGASSSTGWQTLCKALVQYDLDKNSGAGASKLTFSKTTAGEYTNSATYVIFQSTCGSLASVPSTSSGGSSSGTGTSSGTNTGSSSGSNTGSSDNSNTGGGNTASTTGTGGAKCTSYTFSHTGNNAPSKTLSGDCIYYIQTILNGAWTSNPYSYLTPANNYDKYYNVKSGLIGGVSKTDNNYNSETEVRIMALQATMAYNGTPLSVTGTTDANTWGALCALAKTYGAVPNTTAIQLARQVVTSSANSDSGCSASTIGKISSNPHQTTPPPLSCPSGSSMNSAKTSCSCPSGETYAGGSCQKVQAAIPASGNTASKITSFTVTKEGQVGLDSEYTIKWASQNTTACSLAFTINTTFDVSNPTGGPSGSSSLAVTNGTKPFTVTLLCTNKYTPNVPSTAASAKLTVAP